MKAFIEHLWYKESTPRRWLMPFSALFGWLAARRKAKLEAQQVPLKVPVVVVGNISVGGTGKTPLTIALVSWMQKQGLSVGVISRGFKGAANYPYLLDESTQASVSGDEPLLIYQSCRCPVVVDPDRSRAARYLLDHKPVDVLISDDGLQHYRLPRQVEIAVIDAERGLGNGALLPAGPLREEPSRLASVDFIVLNGKAPFATHLPVHRMVLVSDEPVPVGDTTGLPVLGKVHAIAAIGNPSRFFHTLEILGYEVIPHPFDDHHAFRLDELIFDDGLPVMMTAKDAIKCESFKKLGNHWYLPVNAHLTASFFTGVLSRIQAFREE